MTDFIFMLTRNDRTIENCLDIFDLIEPIGLQHIGFKDAGAEPSVLRRLADRVRLAGATLYMELVLTGSEATRRSARLAREIGVDRLLGGTHVDQILEVLEGSSISYYPFPGVPFGLPTRLRGRPEEIEEQSRSYIAKGCAGVDVLAYRATEADPIELVRAARRGIDTNYLIVAGSITSRERIRAIKAAGADAFTMGTALIDGLYDPRANSLKSRIESILDEC